jgi:hypothetical protein
MLNFATYRIFQLTDEIIQNSHTSDFLVQWNYLQNLINDPQFADDYARVKIALDEWKKCLDLIREC